MELTLVRENSQRGQHHLSADTLSFLFLSVETGFKRGVAAAWVAEGMEDRGKVGLVAAAGWVPGGAADRGLDACGSAIAADSGSDFGLLL